jgi:ABC-2 type transport system permease protein
VEDSLASEVGAKRIDGVLLISDSLVDAGTAEYRASNVSSLDDIGFLRETLRQLAENARLERAGVDPHVVATAQLRVTLRTQKLTGGRATGQTAVQSFSLAYFMMVTLYIALLLYGVQVMGSVVEEKTSRVVEVLLSSIKPFELLSGKVLGVGAVSLLQFVIWGVAGRLLLGQRAALASHMADGGQEMSQVFQVPHVSGATLVVFIAFFLGGFFLYSAMFAAVAAMSSTEQEARQSQAPITVLIMIAFFSSFATIANPESRLAATLSLVPFTSPIATPARWAAGNLTGGEVMSSLALLVLGTVVVTWIAARIYRVGILMTGKRPNVKELVRWIRAA